MKTLCTSVVVITSLFVCSCNPNDQSAARENEKALAETASKNAKLDEENSSLRGELADLAKQLAEAKAAGSKQDSGEANAALEKKIMSAVAELQKQLASMDKKIEGVQSAVDKGLAQASRTGNPVASSGSDTPPVAQPDAGRTTRRPVDPPPAPEKPKPKYDINFDHPVMGPGAR